MRVPFYKHELTRADAGAFADVLASPFLTTGQVSRSVEAMLCDYFAMPHAMLTNSWTNGALALLLALDIGPGDEVIIPAMTFIASANVVELAGATVVFADVDPSTLLLTAESIASKVSARTQAVLPVHLYGQLCDVAGIRRMLDAHPLAKGKIWIIEDAAHCFEGERDGYKPGQRGDAAVFSFYATKNVTCGEGGAVLLHDDGVFERALETRVHGMSSGTLDRFAKDRYNHWDMHRLGIKGNLPDLLACLLPDQIRSIDARLPTRREIAERYREAFGGGPIQLVSQLAGGKSAEHLFPIGVPIDSRDAAIGELNTAGVGVTVNYRSVPSMAYYRQHYPRAVAENPIAWRWGEATLTLPLFPALSREEQDYVIRMVKDRVYALAERKAPA